MSDTAALQAAFARALAVRDIGTADVAVLRGSLKDVRRRLGFYRGNVQANAHKALRNAYPVCERLVGEHFFQGMAYAYAAETPSRSGDHNEYGAALPTFIRTFAPAASLVYLPDVAALEWRVHRAHYAADHPPLDPRGLAALSPDRFGELRATLHPACALLATATPAARIWAAHQPGSDPHFAADTDATPARALVYRPRYRVEVIALEPAPFAFLTACAAGETLADAASAAQAHDRAFDLQSRLPGWVRDRVITTLHLR